MDATKTTKATDFRRGELAAWLEMLAFMTGYGTVSIDKEGAKRCKEIAAILREECDS